MITSTVNVRLKPAIAQVEMEVGKLARSPTVKGKFADFLAQIIQTRQQFDKKFSSDAVRPGVLLVMNKRMQGTALQIIGQKVTALSDNPSFTSLGWSTEGEISKAKLTPVLSAKAFADRINFGTVRRVKGRRIEIDVNLPTDEEISRFEAQRATPKAPSNLAANPAPAPPPSTLPEAKKGSEPGRPSGAAQQARDTSSTGGASIVAFRWLDEDGDRIGGMGDTGRPDGTKDQHLRVDLDLPPGSSLEELVLINGGLNRWVTQPSTRYWPLGVYEGENAVAQSYSQTLGAFSGKKSFDLFANNSGGIGPGAIFELQVVVSINGARHELKSECKRP